MRLTHLWLSWAVPQEYSSALGCSFLHATTQHNLWHRKTGLFPTTVLEPKLRTTLDEMNTTPRFEARLRQPVGQVCSLKAVNSDWKTEN